MPALDLVVYSLLELRFRKVQRLRGNDVNIRARHIPRSRQMCVDLRSGQVPKVPQVAVNRMELFLPLTRVLQDQPWVTAREDIHLTHSFFPSSHCPCHSEQTTSTEGRQALPHPLVSRSPSPMRESCIQIGGRKSYSKLEWRTEVRTNVLSW